MSILEAAPSMLLLKATAILAAVVVAQLALRRASAATRHLCLAMAMLGVVLLPVLSISLPVWQLAVLPQAAATLDEEPSTLPVPLDEGPETTASTETDLPPSFSSEGAREQRAAGPRLGLAEWLIATWVVGAVLVLSKLAAGLLRMRWIAKNGMRVTDPEALRQLDECVNLLRLQVRPLLIASEQAGVPLVWGWLRPALIIPLRFGRWSPDRLRAVMLHELGHLKRCDWPVLLLGRLVAALYWFHPLAWLVERRAKHECERACDDIVVTCGTRPSEYASHLLSIARGVSETPASVRAALAVARRSQLNSRLRSILDPLLRRNRPSRAAITALGTVLLLVLVPLASLQLTEQAHANEPKNKDDLLLVQHHEQQQKQRQLQELGEEPSEAKQLYKKGYKLHKLGRYEEAIEAWEASREMGFEVAASIYNIACAHALMGDSRQAMNWLDRAFGAGFDGPESLIKDSDFDPIRRDAAFQSYIDRAFEQAGFDRRSPDHYPYRTMMEAYDKLRADGSTNAKKWHHVGSRLLSMREHERAIDALSRAADLAGDKGGTSMYNLACAYSLAGRERQALEWLDRAVDAGFDQQERFENDPDLEPLRGSADFESIAQKSAFLSMDRIKKHGKTRLAEKLDPVIGEYRTYVRENPSSGRAWFNLGYALHMSEQYGDAADAWEKAASLDYHASTANYNVACAHSMSNDVDAALDALEIAVESGKFYREGLESDSDLDNLRDDPRYQALLETLEEQPEYEKQLKMKMKMKKKQKLSHGDHES